MPAQIRSSRRDLRQLLRPVRLGLMLVPLLCAALPAWAVDYLSAVDDLPLTQGLTEQKDKTTVFDAPVGKIVTAYATGNVKAEDVVNFYDSTLPQLGWEKTASGTYHRKSQTLKIDVLGGQGGGPVNVSYTVSTEGK
ncbi:MAG TPA: hypothetical protein VN229_15850 [Terriglobales bacterium]|nr:hypothetical protein [Terriglobales bacterium]